MFQKILVPLDGSPLAEAVLPQVRELARCTGAEIVLARVIKYLLYDYTISDPRLIVELRDVAESEATSYLHAVAADLKAEGFQVTLETATGPVADAILGLADSLHVDLIAMSTHGRGGLVRFFLGSVANRVVNEAKVPVLLIRPEHVEEPHTETSAQTFQL